jgi:hypothetical protein
LDFSLLFLEFFSLQLNDSSSGRLKIHLLSIDLGENMVPGYS